MVLFRSRRRLAQAMLPAMICTGLAVGAVRAYSADRIAGNDDAMPMTLAEAGPDDGAFGGMPHGWGMPGRHLFEHATWHKMRLAGRLAALRVYLDITPPQEDAFRAFSLAALAMVPDPKDMTENMRGGAPDEQHKQGAFDGINRMAKMMQSRAAAAQTLDQAAQALKATLTPVQVEKADAAWGAMRAHWMHMHRWHERRENGHGDDGAGMNDR